MCSIAQILRDLLICVCVSLRRTFTQAALRPSKRGSDYLSLSGRNGLWFCCGHANDHQQTGPRPKQTPQRATPLFDTRNAHKHSMTRAHVWWRLLLAVRTGSGLCSRTVGCFFSLPGSSQSGFVYKYARPNNTVHQEGCVCAVVDILIGRAEWPKCTRNNQNPVATPSARVSRVCNRYSDVAQLGAPRRNILALVYCMRIPLCVCVYALCNQMCNRVLCDGIYWLITC